MDITTQLAKNTELGDGIGFVASGGNLTLAQLQANWSVVWRELDNALTGSGYGRSSSDLTLISKALGKVTALTSGSPYTMSFGDVLGVNATTNPWIGNLPQTTGSGREIFVMNTSTAATGLIKLVPFTGDKIQSLAANVACYLQNVDQSGWQNQNQWIRLKDLKAGVWTVVGGVFMPEPGSMDAAGSQYYLGKLRHLPEAGTGSDSRIPPSFGGLAFPTIGTFSALKTIAGPTPAVGIPSGTKGVRVKARVIGVSNAAGAFIYSILFSTVNTGTPGGFYSSDPTAHPELSMQGVATAGGQGFWTTTELDIPLNSSGGVYVYTESYTNINPASSFLQIAVVGYYMGD